MDHTNLTEDWNHPVAISFSIENIAINIDEDVKVRKQVFSLALNMPASLVGMSRLHTQLQLLILPFCHWRRQHVPSTLMGNLTSSSCLLQAFGGGVGKKGREQQIEAFFLSQPPHN